MAKRKWVCYILWLFGGTWGLHLFYLNRDRQAFVWFATLGGFGLGYIRDFFVIPRYILEESENGATISLKRRKPTVHGKPPLSVLRLGLACTFSNSLALLFQYCVPMEWMLIQGPQGLNASTAFFLMVNCLGPLGSAVGVHTVFNIGREKCLFKYPLYATAAVAALYTVFLMPINLTWVSVVSSLYAAWKGREWRALNDRRKRKSVKSRAVRLILFSVGYICLWLSAIYFNMSVTTEHGEEVKVHEAINHFLESEVWADTKNILWQLYELYKQKGFQRMWEQFVLAIDPQGETHAQKVLGVSPNTSEEDLRKRYKALAREWHPDKNRDNREEAEKRFMEIQEAYERLSKIHAKRAQRQKKQDF